MSAQTSTLYPPGGYGAPKDRQGHAAKQDVGLPAGTEVFSADNHISVAEDIFYERFPDDLKEKAPRIWYEDGAYMVGRKGQNFLPGDFSRVLMQYDDLAGAATDNIEARIQELRPRTVSTGSWHFPTPSWRCSTIPTRSCASGCSASTTSAWPTFRSGQKATSTAPA